MALTTGDILRVVTTMLWADNNVMQNVFNAVITGGGGPWDEGEIIEDALDWIETLYANLTGNTSNEVDGSQIIGYVYDPIDDDWDEFESENWVWNPTDVGDALPRAVSGLLNLRTTDPDVNGKKYFGGQTETSSQAGIWSAGMLAAFVLAGGDWQAPFVGAVSGADWTPGVWSPKHTSFFAASPTIIIPTNPAYQRRRKRGIGI